MRILVKAESRFSEYRDAEPDIANGLKNSKCVSQVPEHSTPIIANMLVGDICDALVRGNPAALAPFVYFNFFLFESEPFSQAFNVLPVPFTTDSSRSVLYKHPVSGKRAFDLHEYMAKAHHVISVV